MLKVHAFSGLSVVMAAAAVAVAAAAAAAADLLAVEDMSSSQFYAGTSRFSTML